MIPKPHVTRRKNQNENYEDDGDAPSKWIEHKDTILEVDEN